MAGYESAFQAIDETIADCCLRELPWEFSANIWRADPTSNARCVLPKTLSLCRLVISFQLLNTRCSKFSLTSVSTKLLFHKTSLPQNFFSTFCHRGKECTVSSFAGFDCQKAQKKGTGQFCKVFISLKCRIPRKSVDYQILVFLLISLLTLAPRLRQRISEVYRIGRPLILKILKMDKSPLKNKKKVSICRSMMTAAQDKMEHHSPYEALTAYNKAVIFAPHVEDHLSRACADRAACLLEIGDPESALKDIEHALAIDDYPFEKLFELEERRGHALLGMKQFGRARESFQKAIARLEDAAGFLHKKMVDR